ncbi:acetylglutamate kinase [Candidatus Peregrinibacteria bacterium]|nr:acetylglutamate kinase [Candidatus Peregrinibacteria bacterium]
MNSSQKKFYLNKFKNKIFVVKIGGEVITSKIILKNLLKDIKTILRCGIHVILVHGGGPQADEISLRLGFTPKKINGRRITTKRDLEVVKMLYGGSLNLEILSVMKGLGIKGMRVSGMDGNLLDVKKRPNKEINFGFVGDIVKVNPEILFHLLKSRYLPVVSPVAATDSGTILNINADTIAMEIAATLKAEKLIIFSNTDGVYHDKNLLHTLTIKEIKELIDCGIAKDGMAVKLENVASAIGRGVKRVHILNGMSAHSLLLEIFTKSGIGTMIVSDKEKTVYEKEPPNN